MHERKKEIIVKHFRDILEVYEFELILDINADKEAIFRVKDLQNGNLGNIEKDEFRILGDLCERMDIYHEDYIYNSLQDRKNDGEKIAKDDFELITKRYLENENVGKVLNEIEVEDYKEIVSRKNEFLPKDMLEILDEDEYPLIKKYVIPNGKLNEFYNQFSLEQLDNFEETLNQYFNEKSIIYNENSYEKLESKEDITFNRDILKLAEGLVTYDDFIEEYKHINDGNTKENLKQNEASLLEKEVEKDEEINNDYE